MSTLIFFIKLHLICCLIFIPEGLKSKELIIGRGHVKLPLGPMNWFLGKASMLHSVKATK